MAKKFVRGITDIKTISNQDFDTNNVNDLLSDGEHNYIHRKKGKVDEYHCLTDNLKSITSSDTNLLDVTIDETTNSANLSPKHDLQKEQVIASTSNTINIVHGENGTSGTTKVDTNPQKVLEHDNLLTGYGISKTTTGNTSTLGVEYTKITETFDLNDFLNGRIRTDKLLNAPKLNTWFYVSAFSEGYYTYQEAIEVASSTNTRYVRRKSQQGWSQWREQIGDKSAIDTLLAQKQNTITNNSSIATIGSGLVQLYTSKQEYTHSNGFLKTHDKTIANNTSPGDVEHEFNFIVKLNKSVSSATFTLNSHDTTKFRNIMTTYGENNTVRISGCVFTLSGSTLTVSTTNNTQQNYVITFSDII